MKWPTNTSPHTSLFDRLFPVSWFSKSTQKPGPTSAAKEGRFYTMDEDDAFWRLSFRRRSTGGINPLWCDSDSPDSESLSFSRMLSDIKNMKESNHQQNRDVKRTRSPRTECKIRALEEMKKARRKLKKEKVLEGRTVFDSFAVAKSSADPEGDFRESMVEMITERGIGHPKDLEQLLACYLTLNCDRFHGLIIKVFREVWFEIRGLCVRPCVQNGLCYRC